LFAALKQTAPANARTVLGAIQREADAAVQAFKLDDPSAGVPALARGLAATREGMKQFGSNADAAYMLRLKEQQFQDAINTALGLDSTAVAQPAGCPEPTGPAVAFAPPSTMDPIVPGQSFEVKLRLTNRGSAEIEPTSLSASFSTPDSDAGSSAGTTG